MHTAYSKRLRSMIESTPAIFEIKLMSLYLKAERRMASFRCGSAGNFRLHTNQMRAEESLDHGHVTDRRDSKCLTFDQPINAMEW